MSNKEFGKMLRDKRMELGLSLRELSESTGLNRGYLSRLEADQITPRVDNLVKLADALALAKDERASTRESYRSTLAEAAGHRSTSGMAADRVRRDFAVRLGKEGLNDTQIEAALKGVSEPTMIRVLSGEEALEILPLRSLKDPDAMLNLDQEVVLIPESEQRLEAGERAAIMVQGSLTRTQKTQLRTIAKLIQSIVGSQK
jgi:transcriptional regulator with XRE-family HTH domain